MSLATEFEQRSRRPRLAKYSSDLKKTLAALENQHTTIQRHDLAPFVHWSGSTSAPMHRWMKYREAYSPELIDLLSLGDKILDPFSGCGSILVGAALREKESLGIDLNPVAAFSTKVKLTPLSTSQLQKVERFAHRIEDIARSGCERSALPHLSIATKVFEKNILDALLRVRSAIDHIPQRDKAVADFLMLAWLSILEDVGSYFKEGNGIKYRNKLRRPGRYIDRPAGWQRKRFGHDQIRFVAIQLRSKIETMLTDAALWRQGAWKSQIIEQDSAFNLSRICGRNKFDSIIFSPPYANRFDYFESFKVELWFGSFISTYEELGALRKASMRSHLNANFKRPTQCFDPLEELIDMMDRDASSWRMGVPSLLRGYFTDLGQILSDCRKQLVKNGKCFVVVGNSAFGGVVFPTDIFTAMLGKQVGFKHAKLIEVRPLTVAPQQRNHLRGLESYMRESIVVLE